MTAETHFFILTTHRSGSTWVADVLNHLTDTTVYSELFLPPAEKVKSNRPSFQLQDETRAYLEQSMRSYPHYHYAAQEGAGIRPFSVYRYLNTLYAQPGAVGFKLMYGQLTSFPEIWPYAMTRRLSVVHLVRENVLDIVISQAYRQETKIVHSVADERDNLPAVKITLDPDATLARMRDLQRNVDWARKLLAYTGVRHYEVLYEQLTASERHFGALFDFLNLEAGREQPQSRLAKLVRDSYEDLILNYSELEGRLAGSEFAALLPAKGTVG